MSRVISVSVDRPREDGIRMYGMIFEDGKLIGFIPVQNDYSLLDFCELIDEEMDEDTCIVYDKHGLGEMLTPYFESYGYQNLFNNPIIGNKNYGGLITYMQFKVTDIALDFMPFNMSDRMEFKAFIRELKNLKLEYVENRIKISRTSKNTGICRVTCYMQYLSMIDIRRMESKSE